MLVNRKNFLEFFPQLSKELATEKYAALDTETTALYWWQSPHYAEKPRVFSLQFSTAKNDYYFDFGCEETLADGSALGEEHWHEIRLRLVNLPHITWFIHNAKFDMHHLANHGVYLSGRVHCTQSIARVVNNLEPSKGFSLDALSEKYLGANKISLAEYWKPDAGRVTKIKMPGDNGRYYDFLHFDRLPLDILCLYGERDTRLCYRLGLHQLEELARKNAEFFPEKSSFGHDLYTVYDNECELTRTLFRIERRGVQLDMAFVKKAYNHATDGIKATLAELDTLARPFLDQWNKDNPKDQLDFMDWNSGPRLKALFDFFKVPYAYTEKGKASFDEDALKKSKHPIGEKILTYRRHSKRAHTYLENYLWLADTDGVLHCNFAQGGTETGRLSCREPNMQNVPKRADKKETDFVLRKCFVPRAGKILVSMDLDQAEYRLMLDYAGEMVLIERILRDGLNVHQATQAELAFDDYDDAKTMNFKILYGSGLASITYDLYRDEIAISLKELQALCKLRVYKMRNFKGYDEDKALVDALSPAVIAAHMAILEKGKKKMDLYFAKLPNVQKFIKRVKTKAKEEGHIFTWLGRVLRYDVRNEWGGYDDYKAPNGLCQGGIGDLGKRQLNLLEAWLEKNAPLSGIVLHVHDEVLAEVDEEEQEIIPYMVMALAKAYPHRAIPITAGAAISRKSWGDLEDYECASA